GKAADLDAVNRRRAWLGILHEGGIALRDETADDRHRVVAILEGRQLDDVGAWPAGVLRRRGLSSRRRRWHRRLGDDTWRSHAGGRRRGWPLAGGHGLRHRSLRGWLQLLSRRGRLIALQPLRVTQ